MRIFIYCLCCPLLLQAQPPDTTEQSQNYYTVHIRKEKRPDTVQITTTLVVEKELVAAPVVEESILRFPLLYDGAYGLMNVLPYESWMLQARNLRYVVFDYVVNAEGFVETIELFDYNDSDLQKILVRELNKTRWHPAQNQAGKAISYHFPKQILFLKGQLHEDDYDRY